MHKLYWLGDDACSVIEPLLPENQPDARGRSAAASSGLITSCSAVDAIPRASTAPTPRSMTASTAGCGRPAAPEQPELARGPAVQGSTAKHTLRLTRARQRSSALRPDRAHLEDVGDNG